MMFGRAIPAKGQMSKSVVALWLRIKAVQQIADHFNPQPRPLTEDRQVAPVRTPDIPQDREAFRATSRDTVQRF
jgi:hypothetical protein